MSQRLVCAFTEFVNLTDPLIERARVPDLIDVEAAVADPPAPQSVPDGK